LINKLEDLNHNDNQEILKQSVAVMIELYEKTGEEDLAHVYADKVD
jgi:hypothetical protein